MLGTMAQGEKKDITLSGLITDWGGFEMLIAELHRSSSNVRVERGVELPAKEGGTYKVDVVVRSKQGLHEMMTIVECKWWHKAVRRDRITHLRHVREQVGAQKAVCFTCVGFQSGAEKVAKEHDIGLFLIKEMSDDDWGRPGRIIDFYLQTYRASISGFKGGVSLMAPSGSPEARNPPISQITDSTELISANGQHTLRISELIRDLRELAFNHAMSNRAVRIGGKDGTTHALINIKNIHLLNGPFLLPVGRFKGLFQEFECDVIFQIAQSRITIDRSKNFVFSLAIEDLIRGERYAGAKRIGAEIVELTPLGKGEIRSDAPLENGTVMCMLVDEFLEYDKTRNELLVEFPKLTPLAAPTAG